MKEFNKKQNELYEFDVRMLRTTINTRMLKLVAESGGGIAYNLGRLDVNRTVSADVGLYPNACLKTDEERALKMVSHNCDYTGGVMDVQILTAIIEAIGKGRIYLSGISIDVANLTPSNEDSLRVFINVSFLRVGEE